MIDEGYTKYVVDWTPGAPIECPEIEDLNKWREPLFAAELIGQYEELGIGYGNISARTASGQFVISGTQTGHLPTLGNDHYALVTDYDVEHNRVTCRGAIQASSEAMTHAAIYELNPSIRAVVHVHSDHLWVRLKSAMPTTDAAVQYGTPAMAHEFVRLYRETDFAATGIAVMAGHDSGLVSIGASMEEAATRILSIHADTEQK
jgi:L-ribulose-5-phosphate 4-epimerase